MIFAQVLQYLLIGKLRCCAMCCVIVCMVSWGLSGGICTLYIRERETVCYNAKWGGEGRVVVWERR